MDELEGGGCSNNDLKRHVQRCSQHNPDPAPPSSPMASMLCFNMCCKKSQERVQPTAVSEDVCTTDCRGTWVSCK